MFTNASPEQLHYSIPHKSLCVSVDSCHGSVGSQGWLGHHWALGFRICREDWPPCRATNQASKPTQPSKCAPRGTANWFGMRLTSGRTCIPASQHSSSELQYKCLLALRLKSSTYHVLVLHISLRAARLPFLRHFQENFQNQRFEELASRAV